MNYDKWLNKNVEDLKGKTVVLTGATGGIGNSLVKNLLKKNANIILTSRDINKGEMLKEKLLKTFKNASIKVYKLDVSSLRSINEFVEEFVQNNEQCNYLIQNAGIYNIPKIFTNENLEIHFVTNYLGAIYLTLKMLPILNMNPKSKVILQSSLSYKFFKFDWEDFDETKVKGKMKTYGRSKYLLNLSAIKIQQICDEFYHNVKITLVHPGICGTNIIQYKKKGLKNIFPKIAVSILRIVCHSSDKASLTAMYAISHDVPSTKWVAPRGIAQVWGKPKEKNLKTKIITQDQINRAYEETLKILEEKGYKI